MSFARIEKNVQDFTIFKLIITQDSSQSLSKASPSQAMLTGMYSMESKLTLAIHRKEKGIVSR